MGIVLGVGCGVVPAVHGDPLAGLDAREHPQHHAEHRRQRLTDPQCLVAQCAMEPHGGDDIGDLGEREAHCDGDEDHDEHALLDPRWAASVT